MRRELNSPHEMVRRFVYIVQIMLFVSAFFTGIAALVQLNALGALYFSSMVFAGLMVRYTGMRWFEFARIEKELRTAHPYSGEQLGKDIDRLMELFESLENDPMEAFERHKLRHEIASALRGDERLVSYYYSRLQKRHPYLLRSL